MSLLQNDPQINQGDDCLQLKRSQQTERQSNCLAIQAALAYAEGSMPESPAKLRVSARNAAFWHF